MKTVICIAAALLASAAPAWAAEVVLRANPVDADGRVTLGDIFEGAGAASEVMVAQRNGPSVVLEAGQLQAQARQAAPQHLRVRADDGQRVVQVVRHAAGQQPQGGADPGQEGSLVGQGEPRVRLPAGGEHPPGKPSALAHALNPSAAHTTSTTAPAAAMHHSTVARLPLDVPPAAPAPAADA